MVGTNLTAELFKDIVPDMMEKYPDWQVIFEVQSETPITASIIHDGINGTHVPFLVDGFASIASCFESPEVVQPLI